MLALPSREYYVKSGNDLLAYHRYMTHIAILLGADKDTAAIEMQDVIDFEISLANVSSTRRPSSFESKMLNSFPFQASMTEMDRHETFSVYTKVTLGELNKFVPQFNWKMYIQTAFGPDILIADDEPILIYAMPYIVTLGKIMAERNERTVQNYVMWRLVLSLASYLVDDFQKHRVEFQKILLGIKSERHRWSQCVDWTNKKVGMAVGALFIRDNFNSESKEKALEMIHSIREAFNELLEENDWMDNETRAVAKEKADLINERIGYPDILTNPDELAKEYSNVSDCWCQCSQIRE